jgi:hypothetical protein
MAENVEQNKVSFSRVEMTFRQASCSAGKYQISYGVFSGNGNWYSLDILLVDIVYDTQAGLSPIDFLVLPPRI